MSPFLLMASIPGSTNIIWKVEILFSAQQKKQQGMEGSVMGITILMDHLKLLLQ